MLDTVQTSLVTVLLYCSDGHSIHLFCVKKYIEKQTSQPMHLLFVSNDSFFPISQLISFLQLFLAVCSQCLFSLPPVFQAQQLGPP